MPAYYVDAYAHKPNYSEEHDAPYHNQEVNNEAMGLDPSMSVLGGRVHGNPFYESATVGLQESSARMREQDQVYRTSIAAGEKLYSNLFLTMPDAWKRTSSFHVIDVDDPDLVERGEEFVHLNFTDYLARNICEPKDEWDRICTYYLMSHCVLNMEAGSAPPTVALEPLRQLLGLPYEWHGAPVED